MIIDGNKLSESILEKLAAQRKTFAREPQLAFIQVGEEPASISYIKKKQKVAARIGIHSEVCKLPEAVTEETLIALIQSLNVSLQVHGILVQAPLPSHIDSQKVFNSIDPDKDVDGFHQLNLGKLCQEDPSGFVPCTPLGITKLIEHAAIPTMGKQVVILGRSLIVGKPAALLFLQKQSFANATVTVCHSHSQAIEDITSRADILIAAIGRPHFVTAQMIKPGATVIDVGINRIPDASKPSGYRLVGDVDFEAVQAKAGAITPVPGGVGPLTVAMLMHNTLKAYLKKHG
jgi:methylenetetrahydrofolate dehydrogenase (NADP+) / methenyltetrahydrofolate cyclohydrolase